MSHAWTQADVAKWRGLADQVAAVLAAKAPTKGALGDVARTCRRMAKVPFPVADRNLWHGLNAFLHRAEDFATATDRYREDYRAQLVNLLADCRRIVGHAADAPTPVPESAPRDTPWWTN